jgi:hypothetical protein
VSRRFVRVVLIVASVVSFSIAGAAPVAAVTNTWAWVVARNPTMASYTPAAMDQGNSNSATDSVVRTGVGLYTVTFGGLATPGGMVHVTALASVPRSCVVVGWGPVSADEYVAVDCYDVGGVHRDSKFVADFQNTNSNEGKLAYLWADQPSATVEYEPNAAYSYNSTGATNTVVRFSTGFYQASFPGLGSGRGSVQVSGYGIDPVICRAVSWLPNFGAESVRIKCRDDIGNLVDSMFTVTFMQGLGLKGIFRNRVAYLWANHSGLASYQPDSHYRYSSAGTVATITRTGQGRYTVEIPDMARGGAALVTTTGPHKPLCWVTSIRTDGTPQRIGVRCTNVVGAPVDAPFVLAYLK